MTAARLAFGLLRPAAVLGGATLIAVALIAVLAVVVARHCTRPFPPEAVLVPLVAVPSTSAPESR